MCACSQKEKYGRIYIQILMTARIDVIFLLIMYLSNKMGNVNK